MASPRSEPTTSNTASTTNDPLDMLTVGPKSSHTDGSAGSASFSDTLIVPSHVSPAATSSSVSTEEAPQPNTDPVWRVAEETDNRRKLLRDFILHVLSVAVFITIVFLQRDVNGCNDIQDSISTALLTNQIDYALQKFAKGYMDIAKWDEYRDFLIGDLAEGIQVNVSYNNAPLTNQTTWLVGNQNRILGAVRFRQLRVSNDSCTTNAQFSRPGLQQCYADVYSASTKEDRPFGPSYNTTKYHFSSDTGGIGIFGYASTGSYYPAEGYVVDIPLDDNFSNRIQELIDDEWWDVSTRAIMTHINFLNPNTNKISSMYLVTEFTAGGRVFPTNFFRTFRVFLYRTAVDRFRAFLEVLFLIFLVYYIIVEIIEARRIYKFYHSLRIYFWDFWNIVDIIHLSLFFAGMVLYFIYLNSTSLVHKVDPSVTDTYVSDIEILANHATRYFQLNAVSILIQCILTFKYLQMNERLYAMWQALFNAKVDIAMFLVIFLIMLFAWVFFGWLAFGPDLDYFNGFVMSIGSCWTFMLGNPPEYDDLYSVNRVLGPLFFAFFSIFVFFIMANVFVAIVSDSYAELHSKIETLPAGINPLKPLKRGYQALRLALKGKKVMSTIDIVLSLPNKDLLKEEDLPEEVIKQELIKGNVINNNEDPYVEKYYIAKMQYLHTKILQSMQAKNQEMITIPDADIELKEVSMVDGLQHEIEKIQGKVVDLAERIATVVDKLTVPQEPSAHTALDPFDMDVDPVECSYHASDGRITIGSSFTLTFAENAGSHEWQ